MVVRTVWNGKCVWECKSSDLSLDELSMKLVEGEETEVGELLRCVSLCNDAVVVKKADVWSAYGEATEVRLFEATLTLGCLANICRQVRFSKVWTCCICSRSPVAQSWSTLHSCTRTPFRLGFQTHVRGVSRSSNPEQRYVYERCSGMCARSMFL